MSDHQTSLSLLTRLRDEQDGDAWQRLVEIYTPLMRTWLLRYEVQQADADDLVQEVLAVVARQLAEFEHNERAGAFRAWLRTILVHRLRDFWRARGRRPVTQGGTNFQQQLDQLEDPTSALSQLWNRQHDHHVVKQLLERAEKQFAPKTWQAFYRVAIEGKKADAVAAELGLTLNAVFIAKSRVLSRLRQEADGLVDSPTDFFDNC